MGSIAFTKPEKTNQTPQKCCKKVQKVFLDFPTRTVKKAKTAPMMAKEIINTGSETTICSCELGVMGYKFETNR